MLAPHETRCLGGPCVIRDYCQRLIDPADVTKRTPIYSRHPGNNTDCPLFKRIPQPSLVSTDKTTTTGV